MKFLRRNLSDVTTSRRRRRNVLLSDSSVTLKFFSPDNIKKLKNSPKINTVADESVNDIPTIARGDLSVIKGPTRFVRIKSGMVSLSETPFTSDQREDMTSQQPKQNHLMNESETPQTVKETVAEPIKRDISHAPNKLTPRVTSREGLAEPPWSRATSPGDGENHGTKKKKTKIYIHDGSRSQSRSTSSSVEPEEKKEPAESRDEKNNEQEQKEAPKSKPKLSLKLSLK